MYFSCMEDLCLLGLILFFSEDYHVFLMGDLCLLGLNLFFPEDYHVFLMHGRLVFVGTYPVLF